MSKEVLFQPSTDLGDVLSGEVTVRDAKATLKNRAKARVFEGSLVTGKDDSGAVLLAGADYIGIDRANVIASDYQAYLDLTDDTKGTILKAKYIQAKGQTRLTVYDPNAEIDAYDFTQIIVYRKNKNIFFPRIRLHHFATLIFIELSVRQSNYTAVLLGGGFLRGAVAPQPPLPPPDPPNMPGNPADEPVIP